MKHESYNATLSRLFPDEKLIRLVEPSKQDDPAFIDSDELSRRLNLPVSWIRDRVRRRHNPATRIPHRRFGKYVRFEWGSPRLTEWLEKKRQ